MNPTLLNLFSTTTTSQTSASNPLSATSSQSASGSSAANLGDVMFGQLLTAQLQNSGSASLSASGNLATSSLSSQALAQLKNSIAQMLQSGMSVQQIANQLAQSLGSNFSAQLALAGINLGANGSGSLMQMLAQALGPPGNGPPQGVASALVQRFAQVANVLSRVEANAAGQQQDSLGTISDANAGDTPAPNTLAGIAQTALVALQQSANGPSGTSLSSSPAPPPAPWVPTSSSATPGATFTQGNGGPTVALDPSLSTIGTGADTVIGRILARAANVAAAQNPSANGVQPAQSTQSAQSTQNAQSPGAAQSTATLQPQIAVSAANSASNGVMNDALTASVLRTVQTLLASIPPPKTDSAATADAATSASSTATNSSVFATLGMTPVVTTTVGTASAAPASQLPAQAPVDANAVVDQVLQGISMRTLSNGSQTVQMRLVPDSLGSVTVNLSVQGNTVNATMLAQNTDVRDALLANQQALARSMADSGLKLASFTVNLANNGQFQQQQTAYQQSRFGTTRRFFGVNSTSDEPTVASVVPTYGPPSTQLAALQWLNALA